MSKKYYAVAKGVQTGIFNTWDECSKMVTGYSGATFKSFKKREDAEKYMKEENPTYFTDKYNENTEKIENSMKKFDGSTKPYISGDDCLNLIIKRGKELEEFDITKDIYEEDDSVRETKKRKREEKKKIISSKRNKSESKKYLNIFTDGSCANNGTKDAVGGIGIYFEDEKYESISKKITGEQTNNRAELSAILEAIKIVKTDENIIINSDSSYSIKGITGVNKIYKNKDLFNEITSLIIKRKGETKFNKVTGHSGSDDGNHKADRLAAKATE